MIVYVLVNEEGKVEGWGSTRSMDSEVEIEIPDDHPFTTDAYLSYKLIDGVLVKDEEHVLDLYKQEKDDELNQACKNAILAGFSHTINGVVYWFSYDMEAQGNFRDAKEMLSDAVVSEIPWTVRIGGVDGAYTRIPITLPIIKELSLVIMNHKMNNISKYRDFLMPIVNGAETPEEVEEVTW